MGKVKLNKKGFKSSTRLDIDLLENLPEGLPDKAKAQFLSEVYDAVDEIAYGYSNLHVIDIGWDNNGTHWYDKELLTTSYKFK